MPAIRFMITKCSVSVQNRGEHYSLAANALIVTDNHTLLVNPQDKINVVTMDFYNADLQQLYAEVVELLDPESKPLLHKETVKQVNVEKEVVEVLSSLSKLSAPSFLQFCYVYCLSLDRHYFSSLLRLRISSNKSFCDFIEENFLQPWSITELAEEFDLPVRKFNQLFQDCYGKSAKRWLLERRLKHARKLLITTPMRVLDIALECGFSNHAHFTDSFRRHFCCNPKQIRQSVLTQSDNIV